MRYPPLGYAADVSPTIAERLVPATLSTRLGSRARDLVLVGFGVVLIALSATYQHSTA